MTPRPIALTEIVDGLRKRVASAHEAIAQCSKDRESCPPDDRCDDCEAEQQLIVLLDAAIARLEQSEQERGEMKPTETCSVCGHAAHRRGDYWVAVGVDKHGDDAMCPCIAHILAATPSPEEP